MARYCFLLRVRPEHMEEYRRRHAAVWPEMLSALAETGWRNYSLFLHDDGLLVGQIARRKRFAFVPNRPMGDFCPSH
jgi:L-rhamnose mutarotase